MRANHSGSSQAVISYLNRGEMPFVKRGESPSMSNYKPTHMAETPRDHSFLRGELSAVVAGSALLAVSGATPALAEGTEAVTTSTSTTTEATATETDAQAAQASAQSDYDAAIPYSLPYCQGIGNCGYGRLQVRFEGPLHGEGGSHEPVELLGPVVPVVDVERPPHDRP